MIDYDILTGAMARNPDAPSRMEILVLSSLARTPMHGYDLKLELRYKHVRWWAKAEHGHLYAALSRLERRGFIRRQGTKNGRRRVYAPTEAGMKRLKEVLAQVAVAPDATYFDVDLFLSGAFVLGRKGAVAILGERRTALVQQLAEARTLRDQMVAFVPIVGRLIMDHRVDHLEREVAFTERAAEALRADAAWGSFLGTAPIRDFVQKTGVPLEDGRRKRK